MGAGKQRHDGEGTIFKITSANGSVRWKAQETYRDDAGKRRYISGTGSTPAEASNRRLANREKLRMREASKRNPSPTVKQYFVTYLANRKSALSAETYRKYSREFELHVFPHLGNMKLTAITVTDLDEFFYTAHANIGDSARLHLYTNLNTFLNHAVKHNELPKNPMANVNKPEKFTKVAREDARLVNARVNIYAGFLKWLAKEEERRDHFRRFQMMALGLRRAELLGLEWKCVQNLKVKGKATLIVQQQLKRYEKHQDGEGLYIQPHTKTKRDRVIYLDETFRQLLLEIKKEERTAKEEWAKDLIFLTPSGAVLSPSNHDEYWRVLLRAYLTSTDTDNSELYFRPHYMRHIAASFLLNKGISITMIQDILGHHQAAMALHYSHLNRDSRKEAGEALGALLPVGSSSSK